MHVGIVDFTTDGSLPASQLSGDVAWRSRWTDLDTWLRSSPVDAVVFQVDLDDHPELMRTLNRVREANGGARLVLSGTSSSGALTAEITSITIQRAAAREVPLSTREVQVLGAIRSGRTNREIAALLGISLSTVNKHVENILRKLSARNRAQAAAGASSALQATPQASRAAVYPLGRGRKPREAMANG